MNASIESLSPPAEGLASGAAWSRLARAAADAAARAGAPERGDARLWEVSRQFESMFLGQMYKAMRKSAAAAEAEKPSPGREIFTDLLDQEYAKLGLQSALGEEASSPAKGVGNGLAAMIYRSLKRRDPSDANVPAGSAPAGTALDGSVPGKSAPAATPDFRPERRLAPESLAPLVEAASRRFGLSRNLILSVIRQESGFDPRARSGAGAKGLMQIMDATATDLGLKDAFDPRENVMAGARYLKGLLNRFGGDIRLALAGYNAGPGYVERYGGIPPFPETRRYVDSVLAIKARLDANDGKEAANVPGES